LVAIYESEGFPQPVDFCEYKQRNAEKLITALDAYTWLIERDMIRDLSVLFDGRSVLMQVIQKFVSSYFKEPSYENKTAREKFTMKEHRCAILFKTFRLVEVLLLSDMRTFATAALNDLGFFNNSLPGFSSFLDVFFDFSLAPATLGYQTDAVHRRELTRQVRSMGRAFSSRLDSPIKEKVLSHYSQRFNRGLTTILGLENGE
jgi:hypothetical protein